jgi:hypothetical protein
MTDNPFTERSRITKPEHFVGRWVELSILFDRIETRRPVLVAGVGGIGRSSLLTHVVQAAAANFDNPELAAFYLDLNGASEASQVFRALTSALHSTGETLAALEVALIESGREVIICLDNAQAVLMHEWGQALLEGLARTARSGALKLVAAVAGRAPALSEPFATITLGAFQPAEIRLLADAYLEGTGVSFGPADLAALAAVSGAHPAYLQRAAFYLFRAKREPGFDWRSAFAAEARDAPVPGAPLPPSVFEGDEQGDAAQGSRAGQGQGEPAGPQPFVLPSGDAGLLIAGALLIGAILVVAGYAALGALLVVAGAGLAWYTRG